VAATDLKRKGARGFALGGLVALAVSFLGAVLFVGPPIGFFLGGLLGAGMSGLDGRTQVRFALGFLVPGVVVPLAFISLRTMAHSESHWVLLAACASFFGLAYACAGAVGATALAGSGRLCLRLAGRFALAGVAGSLFAAVPFLLMAGRANYGGFGKMGPVVLSIGVFLSVLVPFVAAGYGVGAAREELVGRRLKRSEG
jgi:hypothetical protein